MHARLSLLACAALLVAGCDDLEGVLGADAGLSDVGGDSGPDVPLDVTLVEASFSLEGDDFYRMPWPSDARLTADGHLDMSDFPDPGVPLFTRYADEIEKHLDGYSLMQVLYIALDGDPIPNTPPTPLESTFSDGAIQLIDVSPEGCGARIPIETVMNHEVDAFIPDNVLMAAPVPGFVMTPRRSYAYVVLRSLGNPDGFGVAVSADTADALAGTHSDATLNDSFAPLRDCLPTLDVSPDDIAVATVFTTHDPLWATRALRDAVADPDNNAPVVKTFGYSDDLSTAAYRTFRGTYDTPMFQEGVSPYATVGGAITFGADGVPVQVGTEEVPFSVVTPPGDGPFRLLIWVDGTGATETSWVRSRLTQAFVSAGFAVAGYAAQFHGGRATPGANEELHSFNFLNPDAFRNVFRQQVADTSYFLRVMADANDQMDGLPPLDTTRIVYGGQSQGSLVGSMTAGVEPRIHAYMLNGVAAYLALTAVERTDPVDFAALIANIAGISADFTRFHPLMAMVQIGADASDPHAFAPSWAGWEGDPDGVDILLVNGIDDYTAPIRGMNAITIAGDVAPVAVSGWNVDPFGVWDRADEELPIANNRSTIDGSERTQATFLSDSTGHFTVYDRADVRDLAVRFLDTAADGQAEVDW